MRALVIPILLMSTLSANATIMYHYHDVRNRHQHDSNATATAKCDPSHQQDYDSRAFNQCMLSHGWKFTHVEHQQDDDQPSYPYVPNPMPQIDPSTGGVVPGSDR